MGLLGIDFRGSSGYVTDPANHTYSVGESSAQTRGGLTFHWTAGTGGSDRTTSGDARLAGLNYQGSGVTGTFFITLPAAGTYDVRIALGDPYYTSWAGVQLVIKDNGSTLWTIGPATPATGNVIDAVGAEYSAANWPANNTAKRLTFASTSFEMALNATVGNYATVCCVEITDVATGYTLTATAGSYAETGTAAALVAARKLTAAAGSYSFTGTAAGLKVDRKLAAAPGSYSWTGTAAALRATRVLAAAGGSYAETGTAAGLKAARRLGAAGGSYSYTGTAATLTYSGAAGSTYTLTAAGGSYSYTGTAATLKSDRRGISAAGSYSYAGTAAGLRAARKLAAAGSSYSYTGTAAGVREGHVLGAAAGAYAWAGTAAALHQSSRRLVADGGAFTWDGTAAALRYHSGAVVDADLVTTVLQIRRLVEMDAER